MEPAESSALLCFRRKLYTHVCEGEWGSLASSCTHLATLYNFTLAKYVVIGSVVTVH